MTVVPRRRQWQPGARANRLLGPQLQPAGINTPQSTTLGLHPVIHGSLLIYRPLRDGWLSWPCWLTDSGQLNHRVATHPASSLAQDRESSPAETSVLTTMLRRRCCHAVDIIIVINCRLDIVLCHSSFDVDEERKRSSHTKQGFVSSFFAYYHHHYLTVVRGVVINFSFFCIMLFLWICVCVCVLSTRLNKDTYIFADCCAEKLSAHNLRLNNNAQPLGWVTINHHHSVKSHRILKLYTLFYAALSAQFWH